MYVSPSLSTGYTNELLAKKIFGIALFFFLLLQVYGIYFVELRMQLDAADDIIRYSFADTIFPPQPVFFRYAYLLNKLLLKPAFLLHLPVKAVAILYCINDLLFYLFIAFATIRLTRRYDYAAVVIASPVLLSFSNFYYLYNELYLSGAVVVFYIAVYRYMQGGLFKKGVLATAIFFMVWTHPAMLIVLAAFIPGIYTSRKKVWDDKWLLTFLLINVMARVFLFSGYDHSHLQRINGAFNLQLFVHNCIDYLKLYWYLPVLAILGLWNARRNDGDLSAYRGFIILPITIYLLGQNNVHLADANFPKYAYPLNLFMLAVGLKALIQYTSRKQMLSLVFTVLIFSTSGFALMYTFHTKLTTHATVLKVMNTLCIEEDASHSKWYVKNDSLLLIDPLYTGINSESILFSALANNTTTVQVVNVTANDIKAMGTLPSNEFYLNGLASLPITNLNPYYFNFNGGVYKELVLDDIKLNTIRSAIVK